MTFKTLREGDGDDDTPIIKPDEGTVGPDAGEYNHPEGVPGDPVVDNSQFG